MSFDAMGKMTFHGRTPLTEDKLKWEKFYDGGQLFYGDIMCTSGISDKETFVVTDRELGKMLPHRDLEIVQEVQKV